MKVLIKINCQFFYDLLVNDYDKLSGSKLTPDNWKFIR